MKTALDEIIKRNNKINLYVYETFLADATIFGCVIFLIMTVRG